MQIYGEKVFLTPITLNDCEDFVRWRNSDFIRSKFIFREEITIENQGDWIRKMVETGKVEQFIIWDKKDKKKIGSVYLQHIDKRNRKCEFGILIGEKEYIGEGRGTEANQLVCKYGFEMLGMKQIYLRVLASNVRAIKSYVRAGFKEEYISHNDVWIDGEAVDVVYMSKRG